MTVRELIKGSMRLIGATSVGETPSADEISDGLLALNDMIDSWATERLMVFNTVREEFSLVPGTQSYTIGAAGVFVTARPMRIEDAKIELQNVSPTVEVPLLVINVDEWSEIRAKDLTAGIPTKLYVENGSATNTLYFWPIPTVAHKLVIYSYKPFTAFADANAVVSFPPGYSEALRYNLAVRLSPEYGTTPSEIVYTTAMESKENIKRMNIKPQYMSIDSFLTTGSGGAFNIITGE